LFSIEQGGFNTLSTSEWELAERTVKLLQPFYAAPLTMPASFLKRSFKYGFCTGINTVELLAQEADGLLFTKMASDQHCIHFLLPDIK